MKQWTAKQSLYKSGSKHRYEAVAKQGMGKTDIVLDKNNFSWGSNWFEFKEKLKVKRNNEVHILC